MFRDGAIEAATGTLLHYKEATDRQIYGRYFEQQLIDAATRFLELMDILGVSSPVAVMLSLLNVKGFTIVDSDNPLPRSINSIDRDDLFIYPEITDSLGTSPATLLRPLFAAVWNAAGVAASPHIREPPQPDREPIKDPPHQPPGDPRRDRPDPPPERYPPDRPCIPPDAPPETPPVKEPPPE